MVKWLSCAVVIVGLFCGQVLAGESIYGTTPIDYFGEKEKAEKAEVRKIEDLNLDEKLELISARVDNLECYLQMITGILNEQLAVLKEIKADQNKTANLSTEDILKHLSLTESYSRKTSNEKMNYICGYQTASYLNRYPGSDIKEVAWNMINKCVRPGSIQCFSQKDWLEGYWNAERALPSKH